MAIKSPDILDEIREFVNEIEEPPNYWRDYCPCCEQKLTIKGCMKRICLAREVFSDSGNHCCNQRCHPERWV